MIWFNTIQTQKTRTGKLITYAGFGKVSEIII